jgi:hypothetical protein
MFLLYNILMDVIPILILSNQGWEKDLAHHYPGKKLGVKKKLSSE